MTLGPEDVAAMIARTEGWFSECPLGDELSEQRALLIVALEAAWAELENVKGWTYGKGGWSDAYNQQRERAETAEAEIEAMKVDADIRAKLRYAEIDRLDAALARARALCDDPVPARLHGWTALGYETAMEKIRAALEGEQS